MVAERAFWGKERRKLSLLWLGSFCHKGWEAKEKDMHLDTSDLASPVEERGHVEFKGLTILKEKPKGGGHSGQRQVSSFPDTNG